MATKRKLERRIASTEDMASIVGTMKALAAVNVRIFDRAREAIENYLDTVERGLQIALRSQEARAGEVLPFQTDPARTPAAAGLFVFGSVQGMCGQFNEHIARYAAKTAGETTAPVHIVAVGERIRGRLEDAGLVPEYQIGLEGRLDALPNLVDRCILQTETLQRKGIGRLVVCYNRQSGQPAYEPGGDLVLPIAMRWVEDIRTRGWPTRQLPIALTPGLPLIRSLVRQYLFSSFYGAAAQSLASENAARLAAMQSAEKNIDERLEELQGRYHRQRQSEITEELLDIVSGYTALEEAR